MKILGFFFRTFSFYELVNDACSIIVIVQLSVEKIAKFL